ncbi:hypothetical protein LXL04_015359 [Taraxacum kok-saghyz]
MDDRGRENITTVISLNLNDAQFMLVQMRTIIEFENGGTNLDGISGLDSFPPFSNPIIMLVQMRTIIEIENGVTNMDGEGGSNENKLLKRECENNREALIKFGGNFVNKKSYGG